jgi:hypothetical protein
VNAEDLGAGSAPQLAMHHAVLADPARRASGERHELAVHPRCAGVCASHHRRGLALAQVEDLERVAGAAFACRGARTFEEVGDLALTEADLDHRRGSCSSATARAAGGGVRPGLVSGSRVCRARLRLCRKKVSSRLLPTGCLCRRALAAPREAA